MIKVKIVLDRFTYYLAKIVKKSEKKFSTTFFYLFPLRIYLRFLEKIYFKKVDQTFCKISNYFVPEKFKNYNKILVISGGLGFDVEFEKKMIESKNISKILAFDPLELKDEITNSLDSQKVKVFKRPLYISSSKVKIFKPYEKNKNPNVSIDGVYTDSSNYEYARSIDILSVIKYSKFSKYDYKILKLDIEGVADLVIGRLLNNQVFADVFCFELERPTSIFRQFNYFARFFKLVKIMKKNYKIYYFTNQKLGHRLELVAVRN